ncbi:MAG TPA: SGNH/GDSL hydrolase family protein [Balneolales bacterium]|nr:SGNH/GDSL hydrolase family protein [Balneolales bacterium]
MKKYLLHLLIISFALVTYSCKDYNSHPLEAVSTGSANFSKYVAVGNSLTAGYESGALYQEAQKYSYPNLIARQLHIKDFEQPLVASPGIGQRLEISNFQTFSITANTQTGNPLNENLSRPYDNLGIPGAVLVDYSNDNDQGQLKERATNQNRADFNPFYQLVMRTELQKPAPNINDLVTALNPTFVTFWLGNNDALNYVLDGGAGRSFLPPTTFQALYQRAAQLLAATNANVAFMNIPNVTDIPFVFQTNAQLMQEGKIKLNAQNQYQLVTPQGDLNIYIKTEDTTRVMMKNDFLLLTAQEYLTQALANNMPPVTPQTAIPSQYVLDGPAGGQPGSSELEKALTTIAQYNAAISGVVQSNPDKFMLININGFFNNIITSYLSKGYGYLDASQDTLNPVIGSLFSLDGVHPTNKGYALVANEIIKDINSKYNAKIPEIDVRQIPLGLPWKQ